MPDTPTTALVKTAQSPALARVSNQLSLTDKLLTKPEEPFLIPYRKGNKWGYCDRDKNIVIDCVYDEVRRFREGLAATNRGYINFLGDIVIDCTSLRLNRASSFKSGVAIVSSHDTDKYAVIDRLGGLITPFKYGYLEEPSCGVMVTTTDHYDNAYIIDLLGNEIRVDNADSLQSFKNDSAICFKFDKELGRNYRYIDRNGHSFTDYKYYSAGNFNSELAIVSLKTTNNSSYCYYSYINKKGEIIIDEDFTEASDFCDNIALVKSHKSSQYMLIDKLGRVIVELPYNSFQEFIDNPSEGYAMICDYSSVMYGKEIISGISYIDCNGIKITSNEYESERYVYKSGLLKFSEGKAMVGKVSHGSFLYGFINYTGDEIIPLKYDKISVFYNGLAGVGGPDGKITGFINSNGTEYWVD